MAIVVNSPEMFQPFDPDLVASHVNDNVMPVIDKQRQLREERRVLTKQWNESKAQREEERKKFEFANAVSLATLNKRAGEVSVTDKKKRTYGLSLAEVDIPESFEGIKFNFQRGNIPGVAVAEVVNGRLRLRFTDEGRDSYFGTDLLSASAKKTYRRLLAQAKHQILREHLSVIKAYWSKFGAAEKPTLPDTNVVCLDIQAGAGKTANSYALMERECNHGSNFAFAQPNHKLLDTTVSKITGAGLEARKWEGQQRPRICARLAEVDKLARNGISGSVLCGAKRNEETGETEYLCPHAADCPFIAQVQIQESEEYAANAVQKTGSVWSLPHASLTSTRRSAWRSSSNGGTGRTGRHDVTFVDESPVNAALNDRGRKLHDIGSAPGNVEDIRELWADLYGVAVDAVGEAVAQEYEKLERKGITEGAAKDHARNKIIKEARVVLPFDRVFKRKADLRILDRAIAYHSAAEEGIRKSVYEDLHRASGNDGALGELIGDQVDLYKQMNDHRLRRDILQEIRDAVSQKRGPNARLMVVVEDLGEEGFDAVLHFRTPKTFSASWTQDSAIVQLDAHMAAPELLEPIFGRPVDASEPIRIQNSQDIKTIIVRNAPIKSSETALREGRGDKSKGGMIAPKHLKDIFSFAELAAVVAGAYEREDGAEHSPALWSPRKAVSDAIEHMEWSRPEGMEITTAGYIAGSNNYEQSAVAMMTSRLDPGIDKLEEMAEILTGKPVEREGHWQYEKAIMMLRNGSEVSFNKVCHQNPTVQALYDHLVIGAVVQFHARLRGIWRDGKPGVVFLFTNDPLPIEVDQVLDWSEISMGEVAHMLATKGVFSDRRKGHAAYANDPVLPWKTIPTWKEVNRRFVSKVMDLKTGACKLPFEWWADVVDWTPEIAQEWRGRLQAENARASDLGEAVAPVLAVLCRYGYKCGAGRQRYVFFYAHSEIAQDPAAHVEGLQISDEWEAIDQSADDQSLLTHEKNEREAINKIYNNPSVVKVGESIRDARHAKVNECIDRLGVVSSNPTHSMAIAPDLWSSRGAAGRHLEVIGQDVVADGELLVEYWWKPEGATRRSKARALVRAGSIEEAREIVLAQLPSAEIVPTP